MTAERPIADLQSVGMPRHGRPQSVNRQRSTTQFHRQQSLHCCPSTAQSPFKAGSGHSILTTGPFRSAATGRSPCRISKDRSITRTGPLAGATGEKHANDCSRRGRSGAPDPERSSVLEHSFAEQGLPGAGRVCHSCPRLAAKLLRRRQPRPVGFSVSVIPVHASSLMLYTIDLNRFLEESCDFV